MMATVIVGLAVAVLLALAVFRMWKNRKKSCCGGECCTCMSKCDRDK